MLYQVNLIQKISIDDMLDDPVNVQVSIDVHKTRKDPYRLPGHYNIQGFFIPSSAILGSLAVAQTLTSSLEHVASLRPSYLSSAG